MTAAQWPERGLRSRTQALAVLAGAPLLAVVVALGVGALFVLVASESPASAYEALIDGSVGSVASLAQSMTTAIPVILTGIGMGLAFRVGLFNLGGEGQMIFGALATAVAGHALAGAPGPVTLVAAVVAGAAAGAAWALLPGLVGGVVPRPARGHDAAAQLHRRAVRDLPRGVSAARQVRRLDGGADRRAAVLAAAADPDRRDAAAPRRGGGARAAAGGGVAAEPHLARLRDAHDRAQPRLRRGGRGADAAHDHADDGAEAARCAGSPARCSCSARPTATSTTRWSVPGRRGRGWWPAMLAAFNPILTVFSGFFLSALQTGGSGLQLRDERAAAAGQRHPGRDHPHGRDPALAGAPGPASGGCA